MKHPLHRSQFDLLVGWKFPEETKIWAQFRITKEGHLSVAPGNGRIDLPSIATGACPCDVPLGFATE